MEMLTYFHGMSLKKNYREGYIIYLYIALYRVLGIIYTRPLPLYIEIYREGYNKLSIRRRVRSFMNRWGQKTCETLLCWFILMLWVLVCINMYRYERHFGYFYRYSCFRLRNHLPCLPNWQSKRQRHHKYNAYLISMFGHYIAVYIIN